MNDSLRAKMQEWLGSDDPTQQRHARWMFEHEYDDPQKADVPVYPSFARQAWNASKAAVGFAASGFAVASHEEQARRLAICQEPCEYYDVNQKRCIKCGCFANLKTRIATSQCPIGKW